MPLTALAVVVTVAADLLVLETFSFNIAIKFSVETARTLSLQFVNSFMMIIKRVFLTEIEMHTF